MKSWPVWIPGNELKAEHLLGLEEYLLSVSLVGEGRAHGVDLLDRTASLTVRPAGGTLQVSASGLRGVTLAGQPVVLEGPEVLLAEIAAPAPGTTIVLRVRIAVNRTGADRKLALLVEVAGAAGGTAMSQQELDLGTYRWSVEKGLELVAWPMARRLGGLKPADEAWRRWVEPLAARVDRIRVEAESVYPPPGPQHAALLHEVTRLAFDWPALAVPELARQLRRLAWLGARRARPAIPPDAFAANPFFPPATGDGLPEALGRLLDFDPGEGRRPFAEILWQLVWRVRLRVPLQEFTEWREFLAGVRQSGTVRISGGGLDVLAEVEETLARRAGKGTMDDWARAVGLLTMLNLGEGAGVTFSPATSAAYLGRYEPPQLERAAIDCLTSLYHREAREDPAGPLGFLQLARAAVLHPGLVQHTDEPVRSCLGLLGRSGGPSAPAGALDDRVAQFARSREAGPVAIEPDAVAPGPSLRAKGFLKFLAGNRPRPSTLKVVVVGDSGSGRTTLLAQFVAASADARAPKLRARAYFASGQGFFASGPDEQSASVVQGEVRLGDRTCRLDLVDTRAPLLAPGGGTAAAPAAQRAALAGADLVILAIPAAEVDRRIPPQQLLDALASQAQWAVQSNPEAMIAIAYTKADEYGDVDPASLRVVGNAAQAAALEAFHGAENSAAHDRWRKLGESVADGTGPWAYTRRVALDNTRYLWESLLRGARAHRFVNGYFVAARPLDAYHEPWSRRGVLQLFADFFRHVEESEG